MILNSNDSEYIHYFARTHKNIDIDNLSEENH